MDFDEYSTAYLLYAPAKNPQGWNLDLAAFGQALDDAFPEVRYRQEDGHSARLSFWVMTAEGEEFDGFADNESRDTIALSSTTVDEAASFILWLRDAYLPAPDLIRFTSELAYERDIDTDWRIPAGGDHERVADELKQHLQVVVGG
ncbi:hypothetical protein SAMN05216483_3475 [Streptomyces sp. 2131.1]|uniref:hypothetical protein n=1 Tax=Streptomyces sp. 2131.1 TaxID=1855346 RepID=UPI000895E218|nr:hypothetical protein [Streptomyces sp. 2131.1]SED26795.1 hypothetical protein SAMN05216483_3475 [Streptomyces sp. 2131.1]